MNLSVEHVLMFVLVVCAFYYLMGSCGCKEGIIIDNQGLPLKEKEVCPEAGATGACYAWNQNCIYDESCKDGQNIGTGCVVEPNADMRQETRYPCRICRTDPSDLRGYKQCPENANDNNSGEIPFLPIIPHRHSSSYSTDYCIQLSSVKEQPPSWGTGECLDAGGYENKPLYEFYKDKKPSLDDMVKRIKSGPMSEGGFNVGNPEKCVNRVRECYV